jgi:3-hydroxy-3-methylglutaryl CoA synthase
MPAELASSLVGNLYTGSIFMGLLLAHSMKMTKKYQARHLDSYL